MAKKKRSAKKSGGKRRGRFGALSASSDTKNTLMLVAGAIAGVLVKRLGENALNAQSSVTINPKVLFAAELGLGGLVAWKTRNPFLKGAGIGIAGAAGVQLAQQMKVLNGVVSDTPAGLIRFSNTNIAGATLTRTVGGANPYGYPSPHTVGKAKIRSSALYAGAGL